MSKATFITLPLILLLLDYWPLKRIPIISGKLWKVASEKIPFALLSLIIFILTYLAQRHVGALKTVEDFSIFQRIANISTSYLEHLKKIFYPFNLAIYYPYDPEIKLSYVYFSIALLITFSLAAIILRKKSPYLFCGWFIFFITYIPMIGFVQLGEQASADRYSYIPYIGFFLSMIWGIAQIYRTYPKLEKSIQILASILCLCSIFFTSQEVHLWRNSESIYKDTLKNTKNNYLIHNNLGIYYAREQRIPEALEQFNLALKIKPNHFKVYKNIADIHFRSKNYPEALLNYQKLLSNNSRDEKVCNNVGLIYYFNNDLKSARSYFELALRINPNYLLAKKNLELVEKAESQLTASQLNAQ